LRKVLLNPWVIGIGAILLADMLMGIGIPHFMLTAILTAFRFIQKVLGFKVAIWQIAPALLILAPLLCWPRRRKSNPPIFLGYISDTFDRIPYRWEYSYAGNQYRIGRIAPYCPTCGDCQIVERQCPICKEVFFPSEDRRQLIEMIRHGIQTRFGVDGFMVLGE